MRSPAALLNMARSPGAEFPTKGLPFPSCSYGGSALHCGTCELPAIGILMTHRPQRRDSKPTAKNVKRYQHIHYYRHRRHRRAHRRTALESGLSGEWVTAAGNGPTRRLGALGATAMWSISDNLGDVRRGGGFFLGIDEDNPELAAGARSLEKSRCHQAGGDACRAHRRLKYSVLIAVAHGKTTTRPWSPPCWPVGAWIRPSSIGESSTHGAPTRSSATAISWSRNRRERREPFFFSAPDHPVVTHRP